ncbi:hypothetical protein HDU90_004253 [Geranomyces variabilis]|nr:hypothetical protein HDU90_004253 [Geranomyces variabilis]
MKLLSALSLIRLLSALLLGAAVASAFLAPKITDWTGPLAATANPGSTSQPPVNPFATRYKNADDANRVAIFLPAWSKTPNLLGVVHGLRIIGVPARVINATSQLTNSMVALIYTGTEYTWTPTTLDILYLEAFVRKGGQLIGMCNIPVSLRGLFGVASQLEPAGGTRAAVQWFNVERVPSIFRGMNFTEPNDYITTIWDDAAGGGFQTVAYAATAYGVTALADYRRRTVAGSTNTTYDLTTYRAAATVFRPLGYAGDAYAIGIDLGYWYFRAMSEDTQIAYSYIGLFQPGYDTILRIIKNIFLRTPDFISIWTVPYNKGLTFLTTWDLDTAVAYPHGMAIAAAALQAGANGNFNMHTKYVSDAYETDYFQYGTPYIYQITGFPPDSEGRASIDIASHSVSHSPQATGFDLGDNNVQFIKAQNVTGSYYPAIFVCDPTAKNGIPTNGVKCLRGGAGSNSSFWTLGGSVFGEVRVSKFLLDTLLAKYNTSMSVRTYRPGHLAFAKSQGQVAAAAGYIGGSSCTGNGHNTHFPFHATHNRENTAEIDYYEFPMSISDGDMNMSSSYFPGSALQRQSVVAKQIAGYGGIYTILIHPSELMFDKLQLQSALHDEVRSYAYFANTTGFASWWRARDYVEVSHSASGYVITARVTFPGPVNGLTVQVPKTWHLATVSAGYAACQAISYDTSTFAVVFTSTKGGTAILTFNYELGGLPIAAAKACPSFASPRNPQCFGYEVLVSSFMSTYTQLHGVNELILPQQSSPNLWTQYKDQRLKMQTDADATSYSTQNSWYSTLSKFCFDINLYSAVAFDLVAPPGSDFFVSLVSYDSGCNAAVATTTYVRVSDYTIMDGQNRTVNIPIKDLNPSNSKFVKTLLFSNLAPKNTVFYLDNVLLKRRCVYAPGEHGLLGTTIDSFGSLDRWVWGINNFGGATDTVGMKYARMPFLNQLVLEPASDASYFYSYFNGTVDATAGGNTHLVISMSGPAGGSFDVALMSGATGGTTKTLTSSAYGALSTTAATTFRIPLTAFTGVAASAAYGVTLRNFKPFSNSKFTLSYISFGPPTADALAPVRGVCTKPPGLAISNFCSYKSYVEGINELGGASGDDNTAASFYPALTADKTAAPIGKVVLSPLANTTYFKTVLAAKGCYAATAYTGLQIKIAGPAGTTARVTVKAGTAAGCATSTSFAAKLTFTGLATPVVATLPLTGVAGLNAAYLQSIYIDGWSTINSDHEIYYVSLVTGVTSNTPLAASTGPDIVQTSKTCITCTGTLLWNWCTETTATNTTNALGGYTNDDSTMAAMFKGPTGTQQFIPAADGSSYWYTLFSSTCRSAGTATGLQIIVNAPAGASFDIVLRYRTDAACTTTGPALAVNSATYATFDGVTTQNITIPFADFKGLDPTKLVSLSLQRFSIPGQAYSFSCISLTTVTRPPQCLACPTPAVLDFCSSSLPRSNMLGGAASDDHTMATDPAVIKNALALIPNNGSYWYTDLACVDASAYKSLVLTVSMPAGASFNVEVTTAADAGCPAGGVKNKARVSSATYLVTATSTATVQNITIPFTALVTANGAMDLTRVTGISLSGFSPSDGATTFSVTCAYWSSYAPAGPPACVACPTPSVLDYCTSSSPKVNVLGGAASDDRTMTTDPAVVKDALALIPKDGSYWYTDLACVDASAFKYLVVTAALPASASFNIELQTAADAGCPAGGVRNKVRVSSASYITSATSTTAQDITVPFTAFTLANGATDLSRVTGLSFSGFTPSDGTATFSVKCMYWSKYGIGGALKRRKARSFDEEL